jgi:hypothetical protein
MFRTRKQKVLIRRVVAVHARQSDVGGIGVLG